MKKISFKPIIAYGLAYWFTLSMYAQPCTTVNKVSSFQYSAFIVGEQNTLTLRAEHNSIYLTGIFTLTRGVLPPGLILTDNKITGMPTTAGAYIFTIGASSAPGCPIFERTFTLKVDYNLPCTDFAIRVASHSSPPQQLRRTGSIIFRTEHFDSVTYSAISLPPGFTISHTPGSYQATVSGSTEYDGPHTVTVAAYTNKGCTDTISYTWDVRCRMFAVDSIRPSSPKLPYGITGEFYDQGFSSGTNPTGLYISLTNGTLPPGLEFSNGHITGIPATLGIYTFELSTIALPAGCTLLRQSYNIEVVAPNTICKRYDAITPSPATIDTVIYYVGEPMSVILSASQDGEVDDSAFFKMAGRSDNPPPGIILNGNVLSGIPTNAGTRHFKIATYSKDGCPVYEQEYTMHVDWKQPCDAFSVDLLMSEPGLTQVGMTSFYVFGSHSGWDSTRVWAVELPTGFEVDSAHTYAHSLYVAGHAIHTGINKFIIAGTAAGGCQDTLVLAPEFTCLYPQPMIPAPENLSYTPVNEPYYQLVALEAPYAFEVDYSNFRMEVTHGTLPPGIILSDSTGVSGYLHGIPAIPGTYTFTIRAMIETCSIIETEYTLAVRARTPFSSLTLHAECSDDPLSKRWRIHNPNRFNIPVTWQPVYFYNGLPVPLVAKANSDTYFYSSVINVPAPSLPGAVKLTWTDGDGATRSIVKAASSELCDPPACAFASDIVSFHQGLQKNSYNVEANYSGPYWALGEPDAFESGTGIHHYALGYNGYIVLRMSSVINDVPGNDFTLYEFSAGEPAFAKNPERAEVQISKNGVNWVSLGLTSPVTCQGTLDHTFDIDGKLSWFRYVKVIDKTDRNARILNTACAPTAVPAFDGLSDGFDLDAIICAQGTATIAREETLFGADLPGSSSSALYPNPATDWLTIDLSKQNTATETQAEVRIRDLSGSTLYQKIHILEAGTTRVQVSSYRTGIYILHIRSSTGQFKSYKFLKD